MHLLIISQVLLVICFSLRTLQQESGVYHLTRGIDIEQESSWTSYKQVKDVSSLVVCSLSCLEDKKCVSTLYVASIQECQLFSSCLPDVTSTDGNTDLVYIRKYGVANKYRDCQEAFECGVQVSGVYTLRDPDTSMEFDVYCEFDSEHGWTVIQRRLDGSVDFYRGWDDYVAGFGSLLGEYWLGLEHIYYLTMTNQQLSIYLESHEGEVAHANYSTFYIDGSSNNYSLTFSGASGIHSLTTNEMQFTTKDRDNDIWHNNCATRFTGAWWYSNCHSSNLNGVWYPANASGGNNAPHAEGVVWAKWKGFDYSLKATTMRVTR